MKTAALLTDFGLQDPYVGMMKAVILSRARVPVQLLDLTHGVPAQDVRRGAFFLKAAAPYLPAGTLVVAVVDPGVGSSRAVLWGRTRRLSFLAPDNGLLSWLDEPPRELRSVENPRYFLPRVSGTFHGRDVFAPAAAALLSGTPPAALGPRVKTLRRLEPLRAKRDRHGLRGEIVASDRFGNCWTSLPSGEIPATGRLYFKGRSVGPLRGTFSQAAPGAALAVAGSFGYVELAVRDGDFARRFKARPGDEVSCHE